MKPDYLNYPQAWLRVPRTGATPAEKACAIEHFTAPRHMGRAIFGGVVVLLAVVFGLPYVFRLLA